ncbi:MAG: hypothetical protein RLY21_1156 [Planctomycetota bacterium]
MVCAGGCTGHLNQSDGPLGTALPALRAAPCVVQATPDAPSIGPGGSRAHWELIVVHAPIHQTEVQPTYHTRWRIDRTEARDTGAYPTIASALEIPTSASRGSAALEGVIEPANAAVDLVLMPFRMILCPPGTTLVGPRSRYQLVPTEKSE